ncbi:MAG TPA: ABC transporter substrate-binding protein [Symbiobacteriaceae bacterium]|nr:ABC transporter substrate-binding protein [Symbiobacteriaceae bacterium]
MKRHLKFALVLCLTAGLLLSACTSSGKKNPEPTTPPATAEGTPVKGGTYTVASTSDASNLNPILYQDTASSAIIEKMFDSLLGQNDKLEFVPELATELPKVENGGLKWTFKLRSDVKWHDGVPFTSADVKFTFAAILHPYYTGVRASGLTTLKGADALRKGYTATKNEIKDKKVTQEEGDKKMLDAWEAWKNGGAIETPDQYTIIFNLDKVFAPAMNNIGGRWIIPEHILKDQLGAKMKDAEFNRKPIGTGKFQFVEWKAGERIVLKANDNWWGGRPNIDQYVWKIVPDANTAMAALEKGEVDNAGIEVENFDHFKKDVQNVTVYEWQGLSYQQLTLDLNNEFFKDKNVRHALAFAIDKESLVSKLLMGHGTTAWSHATPQRWDYNPDVFKPANNKEKAKQMLDDAGWKVGANGIREKDGKKFAFDLVFVNSDKKYTEAAQVVQSEWKAVGIDVNLKGVDDATLLDLSDAGNPDRKQPAVYIYGWSLGNEPDSYSIWACEGTFNDIGFCNKDVDKLLNDGRGEIDQAKRKVIYQNIQKILADEQPYIWLWFANNIEGISKRVKGPIAGVPNGIEWNIEKWWIESAK